MSIGLMGGTFDPIHRGHIVTAESIRDTFKLDEVYFIPSFLPPHKDERDIINALHRYVMVVLATLDKANLIASPLEIVRGKRSYTIDTIKQFKAELASAEVIFFITGIDSFLAIKTWKQWQKLLESSHFIINSRPGYSFDDLNSYLPFSIRKRVIDLREKKEEDMAIFIDKQKLKGNYHIFLIDTPPIDISSTAIREIIRKKGDFEDLMPRSVATYIKKNKLYFN